MLKKWLWKRRMLKAVKALQLIERIHIRAGWDRNLRRQWWGDFFKHPQMRKYYVMALLREVKKAK